MNSGTKQKIAKWYLYLVPATGSALAFGIGHVHYSIYLPIWIINGLIMLTACRWLGFAELQKHELLNRKLMLAGFFFILPWILISMFAGLGPPPETIEGWAATAREQQLRYCMLMIVGVFEVVAFTFLYEGFKHKEGSWMARIAWVCMLVAIPLFLLNMTYWSSYLPQLFQQMHAQGEQVLPVWAQPLRNQFGMISAAEVTLTYLATSVFALALLHSKLFKAGAAWLYMFLSALAGLVMMLSVFFPDSLAIPGFALSIPAFPFLLPYYMGIQFLIIGSRNNN